MIAGFKDDIVEVLEPFDISTAFLLHQVKVFAETNHGEYTPGLRFLLKWSSG